MTLEPHGAIAVPYAHSSLYIRSLYSVFPYLLEVLRVVVDLVEPRLQGAEELDVVVRLLPRRKHLGAELRERVAVRALVLVEDAEDAADAVALELLENGVQVVRLVVPELNLVVRSGEKALLQKRLRVWCDGGGEAMGGAQ